MALKARILPKFPARVLATNGLSITKTNGVWTFGRDTGALTSLLSVAPADLDNIFLVTYNSVGSPTYARIPLDVLLTAISGGLDATLVAIAGTAPTADQAIYFTGADTAATYSLTAVARSLLDDTTAGAMLTTLGVSAFAQTILDDPNAGAVRTTIGAVASGPNTDITSIYLDNTGLKLKDTNASHGLIVAPGSDLTADRTLTVTTGDSNRTLTISGNPTINQDTSTTGSPSFVSMQTSAASQSLSFNMLDTGGDHTLNLSVNENLSASRSLQVTVSNANRTLAITGNATINQDTSTTGSPTFNAVTLTTDLTVANGGTGVSNGAAVCLGYLKGINLNATGDNSITLTLPTGITSYRVQLVRIHNVGTTASLTTAQAGVFTGAGGTGTTIVTATALSSLTQNTINTAGAALDLTVVPTNAFFNHTTMFFRVTVAQGAAATADVYIYGFAFP